MHVALDKTSAKGIKVNAFQLLLSTCAGESTSFQTCDTQFLAVYSTNTLNVII